MEKEKEERDSGTRARPRAPRTSRSGSESSSASRSRFTRTAGITGARASRALAGSTSRFTRTGLPRELGASVSRSRSRSRLTRAELLRDSDSRFPRVDPRDSRLDRPDIATTGRVARRRLQGRPSTRQAANQERRCYQAQGFLRVADRDKSSRRELLGSTTPLGRGGGGVFAGARAPETDRRSYCHFTHYYPFKEAGTFHWLRKFWIKKSCHWAPGVFKILCVPKPELAGRLQSPSLGDRRPCTELGDIPKSSPSWSNPTALIPHLEDCSWYHRKMQTTSRRLETLLKLKLQGL